MQKEVEAKFLSINKDSLRKKLASTGFALKIPEYLMRRKTFDFSKLVPGRNIWGRVRQELNKVTMSIKEVRGSKIDDTYEVELIVDNFDKAVVFFEGCGIPAKAYQENKREVWARNNTEATIDTWPGLKPFVEIEGINKDEICKAAAELGLDFKEAVFGSIDIIYEKELGIPREAIVNLPEITFAKPPHS